MAGRTEAALLDAPGARFRIGEVDVEDPREDEVEIELVATGICHTDLAMAGAGLPGLGSDDGVAAAVLGHEGAGIVTAVGPGVDGLAEGDTVLLSYAHCGSCEMCGDAHPAYCRHSAALNFAGRRADGSTAFRDGDGRAVLSHFFGQSSFARRAVVSASSAVSVAATREDLVTLAPLGCSVQTGTGAVLSALAPLEGRSVAIFGSGAVGLSAVLGACIAGAAKTIVVEPRKSRRELAIELGADEAIDGGLPPRHVARAITGLVKGGVDAAIDTVGSSDVIGAAIASLRAPGRCATVAMRPGRNEITIDQSRILFGRTLQGVIEGDTDPHAFLPRLVEHWHAGELPIERMIRRYPFEAVAEACEHARNGATIKPVLTF